MSAQDEAPECPHGCGPLRYTAVDDWWICYRCGDEWDEATLGIAWDEPSPREAHNGPETASEPQCTASAWPWSCGLVAGHQGAHTSLMHGMWYSW